MHTQFSENAFRDQREVGVARPLLNLSNVISGPNRNCCWTRTTVKTCNVKSNVLKRIVRVISWTIIAGAGGVLGGLIFGLVFGGLEVLLHAGPRGVVEIAAYFTACGFAVGILIALCVGLMDYESVSEKADVPAEHLSQLPESTTPQPRTRLNPFPHRNRLTAIDENVHLPPAAPASRNPSRN
jgi:hypothetical protein